MTDKEFLLDVLKDGQPHALTEIQQRSRMERGKGLTVHSRAAELRREGYEINCTPIQHLGNAIYQLIAKRGGRVRVREESAVQGYQFVSNDDENKRNMNICKILRRAAVSDVEATDYGPAFWVEFGDGHKEIAYSEELRPWYPV